MTKNINLITYPRSGSHFFVDVFTGITGIELKSSHYFHNVKDGVVVTIARNPIDSVSSHIAMTHFFDGFRLDIQSYINDYNLFYKSIDLEKHIIVDFKDLIQYPIKTVTSVCNILGVSVINDTYIKIDRKVGNRLDTSKDTTFYKNVRKNIQKDMFVESENIYRTVLSKKIKID
jgi:hypothetical protein